MQESMYACACMCVRVCVFARTRVNLESLYPYKPCPTEIYFLLSTASSQEAVIGLFDAN